MRLTSTQRHLLCMADQAEGWMEVFPKEGRTAGALRDKGLLLLHTDGRSVVLTDAGYTMAAPLRAAWKPR